MDGFGPAHLSRRLIVSYAFAFAIVLAVFAISVRFAFVATLERQVDARLETLARAGAAAVRLRPDGFSINPDITRVLRLNHEGLQWFDARSTIVASEGLVPVGDALPRVGERRTVNDGAETLLVQTLAVRDSAGNLVALVRASESDDSLAAVISALDVGIAIGAAFAILTAMLGGWFLTKQSVRTTEENYRRLRQFTADASHELRGPIGAIVNNAQLAVSEDRTLPPAARLRLTAITELGYEMRRLVDDLLILARAAQPMTRELFAVDLEQLVRRVYERLLPSARARRIRIELAASHIPLIYGNPEQIERLIANLVENAIRYSADEGDIRIEGSSDSGHVRIAVIDNGIGIVPESVPHIFERFWRADPARGPTGSNGLGLSIALALARRHGGDLSVRSIFGAGSTFTLSLPRRPTV
jgi:signal transduction histidine kinase